MLQIKAPRSFFENNFLLCRMQIFIQILNGDEKKLNLFWWKFTISTTILFFILTTWLKNFRIFRMKNKNKKNSFCNYGWKMIINITNKGSVLLEKMDPCVEFALTY